MFTFQMVHRWSFKIDEGLKFHWSIRFVVRKQRKGGGGLPDGGIITENKNTVIKTQ